MKLLGVLQGVSLQGEIQNYLDFVKPDGSSFKLPVPEETVKLLLAEIYKKGEKPPVQGASEEEQLPRELEGATAFGEEELEDHQDEEPEPGHQYPDGAAEDDLVPRSEGEVPSL